MSEETPTYSVPARHCLQCGRDFVTTRRPYANGACSACYLHPSEDGWTEHHDEGPGLW